MKRIFFELEGVVMTWWNGEFLVAVIDVRLGVVKAIGNLHGRPHSRKRAIGANDDVELLRFGSAVFEDYLRSRKVDGHASMIEIDCYACAFSRIHQHHIQSAAGNGIDVLALFPVRKE